MADSFWDGKSVFVTGATGLLGGWLVPSLARRGARVVALIRDGSPQSVLVQEGWLGRIATVYGSLGDYGLIRRTLAEYSVETIFHLAAQTLVGIAKEDPIGTLEANVQGTWNLLEAARTTKKCQVLVASSDKAYGEPRSLPYEEDHPLCGRYPYDVSKSCVDLISAMYAATYRLPVGILRCGNLFGGGDLNFSRSIPGLIRSALRGERFEIRSDGHYVRDFLYVEDAAAAYMLFAEKMAADDSLTGEAFNFSLESRLTVLELVDLVLRIMNRTNLKPIILNRASDEVRQQYLSAAKAKRLLGWSPNFSMEEGLRRSIEWYRAYLEKVDAITKAPRQAVQA
jgi:CDP-glucose 4,6-dehydratase